MIYIIHITEGFLPVTHYIGWGVAAAPFVIHGVVQVKRTMKEHPGSGMSLGAAGAFTFVLSAVKISSVTGSTSHPTDTGFGAVIFKPPVMTLPDSIVLFSQTILLVHDGITTFDANIFFMAIAGPWVSYAFYASTQKLGGGLLPGVFMAAFFADPSAYVVTSMRLAFAHPANPGGVGGALTTFLDLFAITQIPLAIIEALVTVILMHTLLAVAHSELLDIGFLSRFGDASAPALGAKAANTTTDAVAESATSQNAAAAPVSDQKQ